MTISDIFMPPCTTLEATVNYYSDAKLYTSGVTKRWGECKKKKAYATIFQVQFNKNHKIQFAFFFFCMHLFSVFSSFFLLFSTFAENPSVPCFLCPYLFLCMFVFSSAAIQKTEWGRNTHSTECDQNPQGTSSYPTSPSFTRKFEEFCVLLPACSISVGSL